MKRFLWKITNKEYTTITTVISLQIAGRRAIISRLCSREIEVKSTIGTKSGTNKTLDAISRMRMFMQLYRIKIFAKYYPSLKKKTTNRIASPTRNYQETCTKGTFDFCEANSSATNGIGSLVPCQTVDTCNQRRVHAGNFTYHTRLRC